MNKLIQEYIRLSLQEKAVTTQKAIGERVALVILKHSNGDASYILYDPHKLWELVKNNTFDRKSKEQPTEYIIGSAVVNPPNANGADQPAWGASEIEFTAARKGYGPLMYDIIMNYEGTLMADRRTVSTSAQGVWGHYLNKRSNTVRALPLDNYKDPQTPAPEDDAQVFSGGGENPLNYAYKLKSKRHFERLTATHDVLFPRIVAAAKRRNIKMNLNVLKDAASEYFWGRYK